jgi:hypothetical protein
MPGLDTPTGWVPVERRLLGVDRRTLVPAIIVAAFAALSFWGVPALNAATDLDDPVRAGDVIQLSDAATFAPAAGWNIEAGIRQGAAGPTGYPKTAQVTHDGVAFTVIVDSFDGTPAKLLEQIRDTNDAIHSDSALNVDGKSSTFTTTGGEHGVIAKFTSGPGIGLLAAFVFDGVGVEVAAYGPTTIDAPTQADIIAMLESVRPLDAANQAGAA